MLRTENKSLYDGLSKEVKVVSVDTGSDANLVSVPFSGDALTSGTPSDKK